jgi:hypothetical protein
MLDQLRAECLHGGVLLDRIPERRDDRAGDADARASEGERLPVIAARRGDDALHVRTLALQALRIDEPAANLERAGRRVILVLEHDIDAGATFK